MRFCLFILTVFITSFKPANQEMKYDENGRIIFTEIVKTELTKDQVIINAESINNVIKLDSNHFQKALTLDLYKVHIGKSPHGALDYKLQIEVRENRYRYIFSDFVFHPVKRNRYGRFVRLKKGSSPLENLLENPDRNWTKHKKTLEKEIELLTINLKKALSKKLEAPKQKQTILNDDW